MNFYFPHSSELDNIRINRNTDNVIIIKNKLKSNYKFDYGRSPEFQPKMVPINKRNISKSKMGFSRYLYIKSELDMRSKLFIGILSDSKWVKTYSDKLYAKPSNTNEKINLYLTHALNPTSYNKG